MQIISQRTKNISLSQAYQIIQAHDSSRKVKFITTSNAALKNLGRL